VIRNNWRLKPVAAAMNLHYNTVKYRYRKIGEILGVDLESRDARINLALAMELYMLNNTDLKSRA
jgi:purine catabolism regulator